MFSPQYASFCELNQRLEALMDKAYVYRYSRGTAGWAEPRSDGRAVTSPQRARRLHTWAASMQGWFSGRCEASECDTDHALLSGQEQVRLLSHKWTPFHA